MSSLSSQLSQFNRRTTLGLVGGLVAVSLAACTSVKLPGFGKRPAEPAATATAGAPANPDEIDVRRYLGPDYCPDLRVREGTEMLRRYERGKEDDSSAIIWQASIGETARECLYDLEGNVTIRIGVSGRVLAGPKGGPGVVDVPLRIAIVKYEEAVLYSELNKLTVTIPASNSTVFRNVYEATVPSPGRDRDYLIYVGFDEDGKGKVIGNTGGG
jgi:hypothetical protein